ncbi:MAG: CHAT domain-containing tetratricopeptide repeat protein [Candidatus Polarisedimenticolia bacterium]
MPVMRKRRASRIRASWLAIAALQTVLAGSLVSSHGQAAETSEGRQLLERGIELRRSDPASAAPVLEKALTRLEAEHDLVGQAEAQRNLGILARLAGRNDEALRKYETALGLARQAGDDRALADVLNSLGILYRALGEVGKALEINAEGLSLARKTGDLVSQARLLGSIARAREELGDMEGSERADRLALALAESSQAPAEVSLAVMGHLAILKSKGGEPWEALRLLDRMDEMSDSSPGGAWGRDNTRALIHRGLGDLDRAEHYARRAVDAARKAGGVADVLGCQHNLALILEDRNDLDGAGALLRESLAGLEQAGNRPRMLFVLNSLAVLDLERGDPASAREWNEKALRLVADAGLADPFPIEETHRTRSRLAHAAGDFPGAVASAREALAHAEKSRDPESLARSHDWSGQLSMAAGRLDEAEAHFRKAVESRRGVISRLPLDERRTIGRIRTDAWRRLASTLLKHADPGQGPGRVKEALDLIDESHGRAFVELIAKQGGASSDESEALGVTIASIQSDLLRAAPDEAKRGELERQLLVEEDRLHVARRKQGDRPAMLIGVPTQQALLAALAEEKAALVSFMLGPSDGWVLIADGLALQAVPLPEWEEIARLSAEIEPLLGEAGPQASLDPMPALERLSEKLLDPWLDRVSRDVSRLIVIPDGILERVPFEALRPNVDGARTRYLVESHSIVYAPSASSWLALRQRTRQPVRSGAVLAVADPAVAPDDSARWPPLPAGSDEARQLMKMASRGSRLLVGPEATEAAWKAEDLASFETIHLAVHGIADTAHPFRAGILMAPGSSREDGWIQMREITGAPLGAELVVLGACRTAVGPVDRAEGIVSLPSAFLEAGARAVVATLWEVGDRTSAEFMSRFYQAIASGQLPAEALRAAKMEMIASGDPRLARAGAWAPFIFIGDPSSRATLGRWRAGPVSIVVLLSTAAVLALFTFRRLRSLKTQGPGRMRNSP